MRVIGNHCVIFTGSPDGRLPKDIHISAGDFVIACDYGYSHAKKLSIKPNLIVGDFDSYTDRLPNDIPIIRVPSEKDDTDTMLAISQGLGLGYKSFTIYGATGGRLDHQVANLQIAASVCAMGANCRIVDDKNILYTLKNGTLTLPRPQEKNCFISVLSHTQKSYGVTLQGLKYPLDNYTMTNTYPIGVSNEFAEDFCTISVLDGILFVIISAQ